MIMTVEELRKYITTEKEDEILEIMLKAVEQAIRSYTNNNFTVRSFARICDIVARTLILEAPAPFEVGDTVYVDGDMNHGIFTVKEVNGDTITVNERSRDEIDAYVAKVEYPDDVKMGAVSMMRWELENREKVGIQSESISRHSVTYADQTAENTAAGYPEALMGFLKPYMRARFGRGIGV